MYCPLLAKSWRISNDDRSKRCGLKEKPNSLKADYVRSRITDTLSPQVLSHRPMKHIEIEVSNQHRTASILELN